MAQELKTVKIELNNHGKPIASIQGTTSYYGISPNDKFYSQEEADKVIAEKDAFIKTLGEGQAYLTREIEQLKDENERLQRALWLARVERYKTREFIAREEACLCMQITWRQFLRERTYNQWVDQLLRIARLANKLHNKCRAKAEEYK